MTRRITKHLFSGFPCGDGFLEGGVAPKVHVTPIRFYLSDEPRSFPPVGDYTAASGFAVAPNFTIHSVFTVRHLTQITPPVIGAVSISMVNYSRPATLHEGECHSMGVKNQPSAERPHQIAVSTNCRECRLTGAAVIPLLGARFGTNISCRLEIGFHASLPQKLPRLWNIRDAIAKKGYIGQRALSHSNLQCSFRSGPRGGANTVAGRSFPNKFSICSQGKAA